MLLCPLFPGHLSSFLCDIFFWYCTVCAFLFETFLLLVFCHVQAVKSLKRNFSDFCMDGSARMKVCMLLILHICVVLILILHSLLSTFLAFVFC
jgi:hypothetical protein